MPKTAVLTVSAAVAASTEKNGYTPLYGILNDLLLEASDKPVKPVTCMPAKGSLRTRQMVRQLKGISSLEDLAAFEEELRGVVTCQESRCRVKMQKAFLTGQYIAEEYSLLCEEEEQCRNLLWLASVSEVGKRAAFFKVVWDEMYSRYLAYNVFARERIENLYGHFLGKMAAVEADRRRELIELEGMCRKEVTRRRFLEASRHIGMELLFQQSYRVSFWARCRSDNFKRDIVLLDAEEERERCSLERLSLQNLAILANELENSASRLMVTSVMRASLIRRKLVDDERMREVARLLLNVPIREMDLRAVLERYEMEKRQEIRVGFYLGWRELLNQALKPGDAADIVYRLEWYERMCVFDQWRHGFHAIGECHNREKRQIEKFEAEHDEFYYDVVHKLRELWAEESVEYTQLKNMYHNFVWSKRMMESAMIVESEEECCRKRLIEAEIEEAMNLMMFSHLQLCELTAAGRAAAIMEVEASCWESMVRSSYATLGTQLCEKLLNDEENERIAIISEARSAWSVIVLQEAAPSSSPVDDEPVQPVYAGPDPKLVEEWYRRQYSDQWALLEREKCRRKEVVVSESYGRRWVYANILSDVEQWNRMDIAVEFQRGLCGIALEKLVDVEQFVRLDLGTGAQQRWKFLTKSFRYSRPYLLSCEVDELDGRLSIITEAETTIGALFISRGGYRPVKYCSEELWSTRSITQYMSLEELLQRLSDELVHTVEPEGRRKTAACETNERLLLMLMREESVCRCHIHKCVEDSYEALRRLFDRIISREDEWQQRSAHKEPEVERTGVEALMDYFRRQEESFVTKREAQRQRSRQLFGSLFKEFYWGRDAIIVEELVGRDVLRNFVHQRSLSPPVLIREAATQVIVRLYNVALVTNDLAGSLNVAMYGSEEEKGVTCRLSETQTLFSAGAFFRICFPETQLEWSTPLTNESKVLFFRIGADGSDDVVATASLLLRAEAMRRNNTTSVHSIPLDQQNGKMNVIVYIM
ncbi:uncharacterized protein TEOVI_000739500 [Trypanosoma equiperdum]|uniref:Uncharacterized protein n=2 Tax=Trypanozoon TaxID=39700 RepID=Q4FKP9_TRYB2|nr:hypothetical protein, conserved [Trypanosoma brucei brucei TREU927]SCU67409.1 hypothetical protein, conserved [Trypanosoma equiperdum]